MRRIAVVSRYAITRLKAKQAAWYWAVHFRRRGKLYSSRFYDQKHGGSRKALAAALHGVTAVSRAALC
jgi:hypothetical protein